MRSLVSKYELRHIEASDLVIRTLRHRYYGYVRSLGLAEFRKYLGKFRSGCAVTFNIANEPRELFVLLPPEFPYTRPRIGLPSDENFLVWPHVEPRGLLCLPEKPIGVIHPVAAVEAALADASKLIEECALGSNLYEFKQEFVSYWSQSCSDAAGKICTLLDRNWPSREVVEFYGTELRLVGEMQSTMVQWLRNFGVSEPPDGFAFRPAVYAALKEPPVPPFPSDGAAFRGMLKVQAPDALALLDSIAGKQPRIQVACGAQSSRGFGLVGVQLCGREVRKVNGFRSGRHDADFLKRKIWYARSTLSRHAVNRLDSGWIHGRGLNKMEPNLKKKTVAMLGCGALGSHVVVRLAQAGVGGFCLVDPQVLEPANIGRHTLGAQSIGSHKATALADQLRSRFPEIREVRAHEGMWQRLSLDDQTKMLEADLIVSAIGEWSSEGPLNEIHATNDRKPPIVYGWLEEFAVAGHALAIVAKGGCLYSVVSDDGKARDAETKWASTVVEQSEPACGTMFAPFGPVELGHTESLVADLAIQVLVGEVKTNTHRVYATSTGRMQSLGGSWSEAHLKYRPPGFDGHIIFDRTVNQTEDCPVCGTHGN